MASYERSVHKNLCNVDSMMDRMETLERGLTTLKNDNVTLSNANNTMKNDIDYLRVLNLKLVKEVIINIAVQLYDTARGKQPMHVNKEPSCKKELLLELAKRCQWTQKGLQRLRDRRDVNTHPEKWSGVAEMLAEADLHCNFFPQLKSSEDPDVELAYNVIQAARVVLGPKVSRYCASTFLVI